MTIEFREPWRVSTPGLSIWSDFIYKFGVSLVVFTPDETRRTRLGQDDAQTHMNTAWIWLGVAGLFEIAWSIGLKYTQGFTRLYPSLATLIALGISMFLLAKAAERLPIGTAYAVWVGIGALGAAILGILLFKEPVNAGRLFFLGLLLISIIGLKITSKTGS